MKDRLRAWGSLSYLATACCLAATRLVVWPLVEGGPLSAGLLDGAHVVLAGAVVALGAHLSSKVQDRWRWAPLALLAAFAAVAGLTFLGDDVDGFSRRQQVVPRVLALYGVMTIIASSAVAAGLLGHLFDRKRLRWAALTVSCLVSTANGVILKNDYWGVHLFVALAALIFAGTAFRGALGKPAELKPSLGLVAALLVAGPALFISPSAATAAALANSTGAPFHHFFGGLSDGQPSSKKQEHLDSEWLRPRDKLPPTAPSKVRPVAGKPLVVMVTVDALRADLLSSKKYDAKLPTLARLRDEGVSFSQARAPGTLTKTSLTGVFMGIHFSQQYWSPMENRGGALTVHADDSKRFTEFLTDAGISTSNYRTINWLRNGVVMRGFKTDHYVKYPKKKSYYTPSPPLFKKLLPGLEKIIAKGGPAFVYTHLSDPHAPYDQGAIKKGPAFDRYLSEVALVDQQLGRLLDMLQNSPRRESTLLIVSADHGEAFGEHNAQTHGTTMYEEVLHVPLVFWRPGGEPRVVNDLVSLVDLGPTILDTFGLPTPGHFMGQSLVPYLEGREPSLTRPIIAETRLMRVLVTPDRLKLIVDTRSKRRELYDLNVDPLELHNLADDPALLAEPLAFMNKFFEVHTLDRDGYRPPFVK